MTPRTVAGRALLEDLGFHAFLDGSHIDDRILAIEAEAAAPLRDALRGWLAAHDALEGIHTEEEYQATADAYDEALAAARRALDEPIEHRVLDREVEG